MGINDDRKGYLLIVPRTGTRARVPKVFSTSKGALNPAILTDGTPSGLTVNLSFFTAYPPWTGAGV
jgi:hypothetical protein